MVLIYENDENNRKYQIRKLLCKKLLNTILKVGKTM